MNRIIPKVIATGALWAAYENICLLTVRHEDLGGNIRAVHLSDFHKRKFGRNNSRLISNVRELSPDIIFLTGDLVSRTETDFTTAIHTIDQLCAIAPTVMIYGNHERSLSKRKRAELREMLGNTDVIFLKNSHISFEKSGRKVMIYGLSEQYTVYKKNGGYRDLDQVSAEDIEKRLGSCPSDEVILLAHNPLFAESYEKWGAEYTLSGHVHGGVVRLLGKGILSPERRFFPRYSKGVYTLGKMKLLVSAGLGKLRLFDPAEIVVYDM